MASFLGSSNNKKSVVSLRDSTRSSSVGPTCEQKAVHIESLLRKLYAKVDELEAVCKEEKEFHQLLKNRGRRGIPKVDSDCLNRVVTSQQRCAESAFNKLDIIKRGNRTSGQRTALTHSKDGEKEATSKIERGKSPSNMSSRGPPVELSKATNDYSNYGSLDRNIRKKKGAFSDRTRRNTKTVGSLAGLESLDVVDNVVRPDEQYKYGLPTIEINVQQNSMSTFGAPIIVSSIPHQLFSINTRINDQIVPSHSALNWHPSLSVNYDGFHQQPIFHRRSVSHDPRTIHTSVSTNSIKNFDPPQEEEPPLVSTTEVGPSSPFNDYIPGDTDVNFNCLAISSPDGISERSSSKSSENGDAKNSFINESCKPFEMSDYYKYSTKFRVQAKDKSTTVSKTAEPKFQRMNGTTNLRVDILATTHSSTNIDGHSTNDTMEETDNLNSTAAPKLPPKLRPMNIMYKNGDRSSMVQSEMQKRKHESFNNNPGHENLETAWMHVNPTIV